MLELLLGREKKTKNYKKNYKIQNPKNIVRTPVGERKKLKITKKLQNTKSQKYNVIYASRQQYPVYLFCFFLFRGDHVKCFAAIIPIFFYAQRRTVPIFCIPLWERKKKLKIPKKITKHKIQKYCKDPVEDMYKKSFFFWNALRRQDSVYFCVFYIFSLCTKGADFFLLFFCYVHYECQFWLYICLLGPEWEIIFW